MKHEFTAITKKLDGYQKPSGAIVMWGDIARLVGNTWESSVYRPDVELHKTKEIMDASTDVYDCFRWNNRTLTPMGEAFDVFSQRVVEAIGKGHIGVFLREGFEPLNNASELPSSLKDHCFEYMLSLNELREQLEVVMYQAPNVPRIQKAYQLIAEFLDKAESDLEDYSDIKLDVINAPINKDNLKNSIYQKIADEKARTFDLVSHGTMGRDNWLANAVIG